MAYTYSYFVKVAQNNDGKYSSWLILEDLNLHLYVSSVDGLRKYSAYDLSLLAEAPSISPSYQNYLWGDDNYIYTVKQGNSSGMVMKYQKADLALVASSSYIPGTSAYGLWGDDNYIYEANVGYPNHIFRLNKLDLSYVDSLNIACVGGIWGDAEYIYALGGDTDSTLSKIDKATFTLVGSVSLAPSGTKGYSICGDTSFLYVAVFNHSTNRAYLSKYWKSLEYIKSTSAYANNNRYAMEVSLSGADAYVVFAEETSLRLFTAIDLTFVGFRTGFGLIYGLSSDADYAYAGSSWTTGIYKYDIIQATLVSVKYPSDAMARVSSIRRIFRPGLYRMEVALGDLGFDWDVAEAAMKKITGAVKEPEVPPTVTPTVPQPTAVLTPEDWTKIIEKQKELGLLTTPSELPTVATKTTTPYTIPTPPSFEPAPSILETIILLPVKAVDIFWGLIKGIFGK